MATKDVSNIRMQFIATNTQMTQAAAEFRNPDFAWTLAPLFAIFSQLHASLLRDCVLHGKDWGWSPETYSSYVTFTSDTLATYIAYLDNVAAQEADRLRLNAPATPGRDYTGIYNYWQPFVQKRPLLLDDYRLLLMCLDPIRYPDGVKAIPYKGLQPGFRHRRRLGRYLQRLGQLGDHAVRTARRQYFAHRRRTVQQLAAQGERQLPVRRGTQVVGARPGQRLRHHCKRQDRRGAA